MKINHLNYADTGFVYCEKHTCVVRFSQEFVDRECGRCEMHEGSLQGQGVECSYEDPMHKDLKVPIIHVHDPDEYERLRHQHLSKQDKKTPK